MPITANGTNITSVYFNGSNYTTVIVNGVTVFVSGGTEVITGYYDYYGGRTPGTWTPSYAITVTAATLNGRRNAAAWSVGYIIKKGTTTVKSGTGGNTTITLSAAERTSLSGTGVISCDCSSPVPTVSYGYSAILSVTYT